MWQSLSGGSTRTYNMNIFPRRIEELIYSCKKHVCLSLNEFKSSEKTLSVAADLPAEVSEV